MAPHNLRDPSNPAPDDMSNCPPVPDDVASRPRVLVLGSPSVGKTTLAHRLTAAHPHAYSSSSSSSTTAGECFSWSIDTKYYTAPVAVWTARLSTMLPCGTAPCSHLVKGAEALLLVFDLSNPASFTAVQKWADQAELSRFEIRLCVGNKADRVGQSDRRAQHQAQHCPREAARVEPTDFDGAMLLGAGGDGGEGDGRAGRAVGGEGERDSGTVGAGGRGGGDEGEVGRGEYQAWCADNGIEYVEACAADETIDEAMGRDAEDMQGLARIRTALGAHMWQGLSLKQQGRQRRTNAHLQLLGLVGKEALCSHQDEPTSPHSSSASDGGTDSDSDVDAASGADPFDPAHFPYHRLDEAPDPALHHTPDPALHHTPDPALHHTPDPALHHTPDPALHHTPDSHPALASDPDTSAVGDGSVSAACESGSGAAASAAADAGGSASAACDGGAAAAAGCGNEEGDEVFGPFVHGSTTATAATGSTAAPAPATALAPGSAPADAGSGKRVSENSSCAPTAHSRDDGSAPDAAHGEKATSGADSAAHGQGATRVDHADAEEGRSGGIDHADDDVRGNAPVGHTDDARAELGEGRADMDEMERLFLEVASVRSSLQHAPDTVRRDTAARLAMRIASMLGDGDGSDGDDDADDGWGGNTGA
ncbi:hypothetical protein CLOM_g14830 [Closterium sp. NIES-68]|nr:hypothetical protein CLOM_g14830 [Closterium sp. NIES-68]GJP77491.1 hypothetical protein CLOP_g7874 [Closterium sp. NIES-67]